MYILKKEKICKHFLLISKFSLLCSIIATPKKRHNWWTCISTCDSMGFLRHVAQKLEYGIYQYGICGM